MNVQIQRTELIYNYIKKNDLSKKIIHGVKTCNYLKLIDIIRNALWLYSINCEQ
jgi:hypothetical protein